MLPENMYYPVTSDIKLLSFNNSKGFDNNATNNIKTS